MSELADFVLSALRQAGGIVDPPAFGLYDVLLPEEVARRWRVPAYQRLSFGAELPATASSRWSGIGEASPGAKADRAAGTGTEEVTSVGYGHPLVETLMEEVRAEPACTRVFVNSVRTDKRGLFQLARQSLSFPNARLSEVPQQGEVVAVCHYLRFYFKAALITDEKREQLISIVMDAQTGLAVPDLAHIERLARLEEEPSRDSHLPAAVRWSPGHTPLSRPVLDGLLERATGAALHELAVPLEALRRRASRYLELDRARLNEYYDDIARDLKRRLDRAGDVPENRPQRRAVLEDKLAATQAEREAKLADVEAKYRQRVELELINLQVIHQPKVLLPVHIGNRSARVERVVVWDPLLHRLEPLACDVCGQAATRLALCSSGHLAHEDCLLPEQCVDCKRLYCRLCAGQMSRCAVCERPVCVSSLNRCGECGRATCREHMGQCHTSTGEPARPPPILSPKPPEEEPPTPSPVLPPPSETKAREPPPPPRGKEKGHKADRPTRGRALPRVLKPPARVVPSKIEVYIESDTPVVDAFVLTQGSKQVAVRSWEWTDQGILVTCHCEKGYRCPADRTVLDPADPAGIEAQIRTQIEDLRREYGIPVRRVLYQAVVHGVRRQVPRLVLLGEWKTKRG